MNAPDRRLLKQLHAKMAGALVHWTQVDAVLPPEKPLLVLEDTDRAGFIALEARLSVLERALKVRLQEEKLAWGRLTKEKKALHQRFRWFQGMTRSLFPRSAWLAALPLAPDVTEGRARYLDAMQRGAMLWLKLATEPPTPVGQGGVLPDGYTATDFDRDTKQLDACWQATSDAALEVRLARAELAQVQAKAASATQAYGHAARSRLPSGHDLLRLLPKLWPSRAADRRKDRLNQPKKAGASHTK